MSLIQNIKAVLRMEQQKYYTAYSPYYAMIKTSSLEKAQDLYHEKVTDFNDECDLCEVNEVDAAKKFFHVYGYNKISYGQAASQFEDAKDEVMIWDEALC